MSLLPKLSLKMGPIVTLTPQMAQSLKLLEMNNLDLQQEVQRLVTENPFLCLESPENQRDSFEESDASPSPDSFSSGVSSPTPPSSFLENLPVAEENLRAHLSSQINIHFPDLQERFMAQSLVDYLDEAGYFRGNREEISQKLKISSSQIEKILTVLKKLEPSGIFSENLQECLSNQLEEQGLLDEKMTKLLENLDLYAYGHLDKLKKKTQLSEEELKEKIRLVRALDPKPGLRFGEKSASVLIPDVLLTSSGDHQRWKVTLNPQTLPKLLVDQVYYAEMAQASSSKEDLRYVRHLYKAATWIQKNLQQRSETILKVASEIVFQQRLFFERGVSALKPCKLSDIAHVLEIHESTVSRTVNHKFMATPLGTFELRYFFTSGITSAYGEKDLSSSAVKARLKILIDREEKTMPLSDDQLVTLLKGEGVQIARRTVTKYRESLGISSSFLRKEKARL